MEDQHEGSQFQASGDVRADLRTWFSDIPATIWAITLLVGWFALSPWIATSIGADPFGTWFIARASPSPGWLFAAFTHANLQHLGTNVLLIVLWGAVAEHVLGPKRYAAFLVVTGVTGILAQVTQYIVIGVSGGIVGASGAAQAATAFAVVSVYLGHDAFETSEIDRGVIWGGAVFVILQAVNDFTPVLEVVPDSSGICHLTGVILGVGYAIYRSK